jgi:5'-nucleotidase
LLPVFIFWRNPLKILISNDDGIHAEGIRVLAEWLARKQSNEVYVVAPERERSATGHSLTLHKPLRVEKVKPPGNVKGAWLTTGTPSDCVKLAVMEILPEKPDIVISGINHGSNLGSELLYSGTVAAAMEGAFLNIPSIAVSQLVDEKMINHYETAAELIQRLLDVFPRAHLSNRSLLNINVPNLPFNELRGAAITELGVRLYDDHFEKRTDPRGRIYYWLTGQALETEEAENSDVWAVINQMASITPISFNMTDFKTMEKLTHLSDMKNLVSRDGAVHKKTAHHSSSSSENV